MLLVVGLVPLYTISALLYATAGLLALQFFRGKGAEKAAIPGLQEIP